MKFLNEEITRLKSSMHIHKVAKITIDMWPSVSTSLSCFLIKKSYLMRNKYRINQFIKDIGSKPTLDAINEDEFVELREVGKGTFSSCALHYHITSGKLCVIKKQFKIHIEADELLQRETDNYSKLSHPFLPIFYGIVKNKNYNIIEFINGKTLKDIEKNELNYNDRIIIIFELMIILKFFHDNVYIYRDLKPDNVMIDDNKNIVLIDLDRLIKKDDKIEHTSDLGCFF